MKSVWALALVMAVSCNNNSGEVDKVVTADKVWDNFRQYTISDGRRVETQADEALVFTDDDKTLLKRVRLHQYGTEGEVEFRGAADEIETKGSGNGFARGNIIVEDLVEGVILEAEFLDWNSDNRMLKGDDKIFVDLGDGLKVSGENFEADIARKSYKFASNVEGTLVVKTEAERAEEEAETGLVTSDDNVTTTLNEPGEPVYQEEQPALESEVDIEEDDFDKFAK